jgi:enamine deaminase RidA (YjgF/YER057c/UK114 family)
MDRVERVRVDELHKTAGYHHVTIVEAGRLAMLAGQCPVERSGAVVDGGLEAQVDQVAANVMTALQAAGATPEDVVRTVIYVVTTDQPTLTAVWRRFNATALAPAFTSASTLLGVAQLGFPGQLVELDATVALPAIPSPS